MLRRLRARHIGRALKRGDDKKRRAAAKALGELGDAACVGLLCEALEDASTGLRRSIILALGRLAQDQAVSFSGSERGASSDRILLEALGDPYPNVRFAAARALDRFRDPLWLKYVSGHSSDLVRLASCADARTVVPLLNAMDSPVVSDRKAVVQALARFSDERARQAACRSLGDREAAVRLAALHALQGSDSEQVAEGIIQMLTDPEVEIRKAAAQAIERHKIPGAVGPLLEALCGTDRETTKPDRLAMVDALGALGDSAASDCLVRVLSDAHSDLRLAGVKALAKIKDPRCVPALIQALDDEVHDVRREALGALFLFNDPRSVDALIRKTDHPHVQIRTSAVRLLGKIGDRRALPVLIDLSKTAQGDFRLSVLKALGELGDQRAGEVLEGMVGDKDPKVRRTAATALGSLGDKRWQTVILGEEDDCFGLAEHGHPSALEHLVASLKKNGRNFDRVVEALGKLEDPRAIEPLMDAFRKTGKLNVARVLGRMGHRPVADLVIQKLLVNREGRVRTEAAEILARMGETKYQSLVKGDDLDFERLAKSGDQRALEAVAPLAASREQGLPIARALAESRDPWAVPGLLQATRARTQMSMSIDHFKAILSALVAIGDDRAIDPLVSFLAHGHPQWRRAAAEALDAMGARLGDAPSRRCVDLVKGDQDDYSRLGETGDPRLVGPMLPLLRGPGGVHVARGLARLGDDRALGPLLSQLKEGDLQTRRKNAEALVRLVAEHPNLGKRWQEVRKAVTVPHRDQVRNEHRDKEEATHSDYWTKHQDCMINGIPHIDRHSGDRIQKRGTRHQDFMTGKQSHEDSGVGLDVPESLPLDF